MKEKERRRRNGSGMPLPLFHHSFSLFGSITEEER